MISITILETPVGQMIAGAKDGKLCLFDFYFRSNIDSIKQRVATTLKDYFLEEYNPIFDTLKLELDEYFNGQRKSFDLPFTLCGTDFQKSVWAEISKISIGETTTYQKIANSLGGEQLTRAVAGATSDNCLAIIIPCHRVVGSNGSMTGYSGGIPNKMKLLQLESGFTQPKPGTLF